MGLSESWSNEPSLFSARTVHGLDQVFSVMRIATGTVNHVLDVDAVGIPTPEFVFWI